MVTSNYAIDYLRHAGITLEEVDGQCGEVCDEVLRKHPRASILYITPSDPDDSFLMYTPDGTCYDWCYHMVPVVDGVVHDAWFPDRLLPPEEYIVIFGDCEWEIY